MVFNVLNRGIAKGIPLAALRGVLGSSSSVEGDLGSHSEEQDAKHLFCCISYTNNLKL